MQQKDKAGIEGLSTLKDLQRLCGAICKDFEFLSLWLSEKKDALLKNAPPSCSTSKDGVFQLHCKLQVIKPYNTGR